MTCVKASVQYSQTRNSTAAPHRAVRSSHLCFARIPADQTPADHFNAKVNFVKPSQHQDARSLPSFESRAPHPLPLAHVSRRGSSTPHRAGLQRKLVLCFILDTFARLIAGPSPSPDHPLDEAVTVEWGSWRFLFKILFLQFFFLVFVDRLVWCPLRRTQDARRNNIKDRKVAAQQDATARGLQARLCRAAQVP